jgi:hypothetical protein
MADKETAVLMDTEVKCVYCGTITGALVQLYNGWCCINCFKKLLDYPSWPEKGETDSKTSCLNNEKLQKSDMPSESPAGKEKGKLLIPKKPEARKR